MFRRVNGPPASTCQLKAALLLVRYGEASRFCSIPAFRSAHSTQGLTTGRLLFRRAMLPQHEPQRESGLALRIGDAIRLAIPRTSKNEHAIARLAIFPAAPFI